LGEDLSLESDARRTRIRTAELQQQKFLLRSRPFDFSGQIDRRDVYQGSGFATASEQRQAEY
jgi:hypothetical protein